jgi:hypothetical protein
MSIFILAALISYMLGSVIQSTKFLDNINSNQPWVALVFAAGLSAVLITVLVALESSSLARIQDVARAPETAQAMLGFIAGAICRKLPSGVIGNDVGSAEPSAWRPPITIIALAAVVVLALLAPGGSAIVDRIKNVQTSGFSIELYAAASDRQLEINVDRDLSQFGTIEGLPRSPRYSQYDCGYAILAAGGQDQLKNSTNNRQRFATYDDFRNAIAFLKSSVFAKFARRVINAKERGADVEILKAHVRPVAEKLSLLAVTPVRDDQGAFDTAYAAADDERGRQDDALKSETPGITDDLTAVDRQNQASVPEWCGNGDDEVTPAKLRDVVNYTRAFHGFVAGLHSFTGNLEGQVLMHSLAKSNPLLKDDINVNSGLASALYYAGRPISDVIPLELAALKRLQFEADVARGKSSADKEKADELARRYERGRINLQVELAYLWALESLRPQEKAGPEENVPLTTAELYAKEAYERSQKNSTLRFLCEDDDQIIYDEDTYALVKLAIQANNARTRAVLDKKELRNAQALLEDARAQLSVKATSCIAQRAAKWAKRIESHLRLVRTMLR